MLALARRGSRAQADVRNRFKVVGLAPRQEFGPPVSSLWSSSLKRKATPMRFDATHNTFPRSRAGGYVPAAALPALLAAALSWWLVSPSAAHAADGRKPSRLESTVDASIAPGDDFFAYANGGWLKATALPAGSPRWGARDELEEVT